MPSFVSLESFVKQCFGTSRTHRRRKVTKGGHVAALERLEERVLLDGTGGNSQVDVATELANAETAAANAQQAFTTALSTAQTASNGLQSTFQTSTAQTQATLNSAIEGATTTLQTSISGAETAFNTGMQSVQQTQQDSDAANAATLTGAGTQISSTYSSPLKRQVEP